MKKILATAYAINPYKGSEDGTGWQYALQIARFNYLTIYTRLNNREDIERYIFENPSIEGIDRITFKYYDKPYFLRFWKKGGRGALLYFYLWQFCIARHLKKAEKDCDIVHNLNFHNNWTPTFLWMLNKPLVWGPVAFHPQIPVKYTRRFSVSEKIKNQLTWMVKKMFWLVDPFLKIGVRKSNYVIAPNERSLELLNVPVNKRKFIYSVASEEHNLALDKNRTGFFNVLSIGRFVNLKGFDLAIKAFGVFYHSISAEAKQNVKFTIIGKGPMKSQLDKLIHTLGLAQVVEIIEWLPRHELQTYYEQANSFLFCSHEGAGMVVPEALSYGVPVICFDNIGPGIMIDESCGLKVSYTNYQQSVADFASHLIKIHADWGFYDQLSEGARVKFKNKFTWNKKGELLKSIYEDIN